MKWFKHDTDASLDAKLQELMLDYGASGYGLYWYCIELIAKDVSAKNFTFELEHDARIIARNLNLTIAETKDMMKKMVELGLFELSNNKIACISLAYKLDDSTRKGTKMQEIVDNFNQNRESVGKIPKESGKVLLDKDKDTDKELEKEKKKKGSFDLDSFEKFATMSNEAKDLFKEYLDLRKSMKVRTTESIVSRLLNKFFKYGQDISVIENAINANWKDFYEPSKPKGVGSTREPEKGSIAWNMAQKQKHDNEIDVEVIG